MVTRLTSLIRGLFGRKEMQSSLEVSARLLPRGEFERIFLSTPDRRVVISAVAEAAGRSEEDVLSEVSRKMKLPFIARITPMDVALLPPSVSIADLRRAGSLGLTWQGRLSGIVCVDPVMVKALLFDTGKLSSELPLSLGSWRLIEKALHESELQWAEKRAALEAERRVQKLGVVREVIKLIIEEAESFKQQSIIIRVGKEVTYSFSTEDGKTAVGDIDPSTKDTLLEVFNDISLLGEELKREDGSRIADISVNAQHNDSIHEALISWKNNFAKNIEIAQTRYSNEVNLSVINGAKSGEPSTAKLPPSDGKRVVMVVDDNVTFGKVLNRFFGRSEMETVHAENGEVGLKKLGEMERLPDALVCDVHMPSMSGPEFLNAIKKNPRLRDIPVVMLTSDDDVETELRLLAAGADVFIRKDEDPRLLSLQILKLINKRERRAA